MTAWLRAQHLTGWRWARGRADSPFCRGRWGMAGSPRRAPGAAQGAHGPRRAAPPGPHRALPAPRRVHTQRLVYSPLFRPAGWDICVSNSSAISHLRCVPQSRLLFCSALFPVLNSGWLCCIICRQKPNDVYSFASTKKIPERWNCMPQACSWIFSVCRNTRNPGSFLVCGLSFPTFNSHLSISN